MNWKKWDERYINLAKHIADWSKDPSTKVGAVIVDDKGRIVSLGFNGFPQKISDNDRLNDRDKKYNVIVHAEANAILFANKDLSGYTIYTYPFQPCSRCAGLIIQSGIKRVVTIKNDNQRWQEDFGTSEQMLVEAGVNIDYVW
jgi:dCMP deaminase